MMRKTTPALVICLLIAATKAGGFGDAPTAKHEVKSLPGWTDDEGNSKALPSRMFTGYLDAGVPPSGA